MKNIYFVFLIGLLFLSQLQISQAQKNENEDITIMEVDKKIYEEKIDNLTTNELPTSKKQSVDTKNILLKITSENNPELFTENISSNKNDLRNLSSSRAISSNLILNGNFESGHVAWYELYKSYDGKWWNGDYIISASSGGYDNWYAYLYDGDWLMSNSFQIPSNSQDLTLSYKARLVHFGTCSYGENGIQVALYDETANNVLGVVKFHDAETEEYDYDYYTYQGTISAIQSRIGHSVFLSYLVSNDDPNCTVVLYLDNVSLVASKPEVPNCTGDICSIYRFWSSSKQGHFFTKSATEANNIIMNDNSWAYEGAAFTAFPTQVIGSTPIYRFWSASKKHHFFTKSENEKNNIIANDHSWAYEGVAYYAYATEQASSTPIYRFWSASKQGHFFTKSLTEKNNIIANDHSWAYEGIAWYVPTN